MTNNVNSKNSKNAFCKTHSTHQFEFLIIDLRAKNFSFFNFFSILFFNFFAFCQVSNAFIQISFLNLQGRAYTG